MLPKRSAKYGIGKEIGGRLYVHRSSEHVLGEVVCEAKRYLPDDFDYAVVRFDNRQGTVSFIECQDFDVADEPTVGRSVTVSSGGVLRRREQRADPEIYHHKWLFVTDDYPGFDVETSRRRSEVWTQLEGIDRSKIGTRSYWESRVLPLIEDHSPTSR